MDNELSSQQKEPERVAADSGYQMKRSKLNKFEEGGRMETLEDEGDYNDDGEMDDDDDDDDDGYMQEDEEDNKIDVDINIQKDDEEYELNKKFDVISNEISTF